MKFRANAGQDLSPEERRLAQQLATTVASLRSAHSVVQEALRVRDEEGGTDQEAARRARSSAQDALLVTEGCLVELRSSQQGNEAVLGLVSELEMLKGLMGDMPPD